MVPGSLEDSETAGVLTYQPFAPSGVKGLSVRVVVGGTVSSGSVAARMGRLSGERFPATSIVTTVMVYTVFGASPVSTVPVAEVLAASAPSGYTSYPETPETPSVPASQAMSAVDVVTAVTVTSVEAVGGSTSVLIDVLWTASSWLAVSTE